MDILPGLFAIYSTVGTRKMLAEAGIPAMLVSKSTERREPLPLDVKPLQAYFDM